MGTAQHPTEIQYTCQDCGHSIRLDLVRGVESFVCPRCNSQLRTNPDAWSDSQLQQCLVCPGHELFLRKNFPPRLGVAIVIVGFVASSIAWYFHAIVWTFAILFLTALADLALYFFLGDCIECYNCHALYLGLSADHIAPFDLETHERIRQLRARQTAWPRSQPGDRTGNSLPPSLPRNDDLARSET
ncbi:MAG TPA: hypothetical protein VIY86_14030 [Pirellulaceae bacterium]